ncbi:hypothetical protein Indivirus_6_2 [Indivirus ILV1]|uniref:Uncharacterized protein n=1 Tax=Indivirus ILV1 TaxID=1977633 RepID=A0A1V0SE02_9VIRU|nr:hypothetical protein Indivirus_6_2 [Indivirus ILV1]
MSKYIIVSLIILGTVYLCTLWKNNKENYENNKKEKYIFYQDQLTLKDITNNKYKIQYEVRGIDNNEIQSILLKNIKLVINKVERIITKSNKINYMTEDKKFIKDLYLIITLIDGYIKEEDGTDSSDTVGGSNINIIKKQSDNIFPVIATIQLLKKSALVDIAAKYPNGYNRFYYILLHEILHTLGIGFLWTYPDYDKKIPRDKYERYWIDTVDTNPIYIGPSLDKYNGLSATVYYYSQFIGIKPGKIKGIPIEDNGNGGSRLYHWEQGNYIASDIISKDSRFVNNIHTPGLDNEIMTAWGTNKQPLISTISIANLEDLGYKVNYNEADISKIKDLDSIPKQITHNEIEPMTVNTVQLVSIMIIFIILAFYLILLKIS